MSRFDIGLAFSCNYEKTKDAVLLFEVGSDDWSEVGEADWNFSDGVITGSAKGEAGFLVTKKRFDNFELTLDFKPDSTVNSGVFVRCSGSTNDPIACHEMNIWDLHPNQDYRTGAIVTKTIPLVQVNTINTWNTYRILCTGDEVSVWINDDLMANYRDNNLLSGYISIQAAESGVVHFRNVRLVEIDK